MGSNVDWNVDESDREAPWRARGTPGQPAEPRPKWWKWLLAAVVALIVVAVAASWVVQRAETTQGEQRVEVVDIARHEEERARAGDMDALSALADGSVSGWRQWLIEQRMPRLVSTSGAQPYYGLAWGSTPLNQYAQSGEPIYGDFQLDGDRATLVVTRHYIPKSEQAAPFDLRSVEYYRFADGAWVHTQPPDDVWTRMLADSSRNLELLFPVHDGEALAPLVPRLKSLATRACTDIGCSGALRLTITAHAADLLTVPAPAQDTPAYVPSPSLIGSPVDQAGQDALYRYYGIQLVTRFVDTVAPGNAALLRLELVSLDLELPHGSTPAAP